LSDQEIRVQDELYEPPPKDSHEVFCTSMMKKN